MSVWRTQPVPAAAANISVRCGCPKAYPEPADTVGLGASRGRDPTAFSSPVLQELRCWATHSGYEQKQPLNHGLTFGLAD